MADDEFAPADAVTDPSVFARLQAEREGSIGAKPAAQIRELEDWQKPILIQPEDENAPPGAKVYTFVSMEYPDQEIILGGGEVAIVGGNRVVTPIRRAQFSRGHFSTTDESLAREMVLHVVDGVPWYGTKYTAHNTDFMRRFVQRVRKEAGLIGGAKK